jgi:hypothetical protein
VNADEKERAFSVLGDYLFELETSARKARKGRPGWGVDRTLRAPARPTREDRPSQFDVTADVAAQAWEREREAAWQAQGRLTDIGLLRVQDTERQPWTLAGVGEVWPELNHWDRLAVTVLLDGVVPGEFMNEDAQKNAREVMERIADSRLRKVLREPDSRAIIAEVAHEVFGAIFGGLKADVNKGPVSALKPNARRLSCRKCGEAGHTARSCQERKDARLRAIRGDNADDEVAS